MQEQIEQQSSFDKVVIWLGLGLASVTGLVAYFLVVQPLQNQGKEESTGNTIEKEEVRFSINSERVLEVAKSQVTQKRSMVVFEYGTGVLIEEPSTTDAVALAKGALAFEAERQLKPVVTSVPDGGFLVTHGPAVVTFLFEEDLRKVAHFWTSYEEADQATREDLLVALATENLVEEAKGAKVVRVVKAKPKS